MLLVPVVILVAQRTGLSLMKVGIPALAGLSVLHGLVPPHPGPLDGDRAARGRPRPHADLRHPHRDPDGHRGRAAPGAVRRPVGAEVRRRPGPVRRSPRRGSRRSRRAPRGGDGARPGRPGDEESRPTVAVDDDDRTRRRPALARPRRRHRPPGRRRAPVSGSASTRSTSRWHRAASGSASRRPSSASRCRSCSCSSTPITKLARHRRGGRHPQEHGLHRHPDRRPAHRGDLLLLRARVSARG